MLRPAFALRRRFRKLRSLFTLVFVLLTSIVVILSSGTGIFMVGGLAGLAIASLPTGKGAYNRLVYELQQYPVLNFIVKFGIVFPITQHYLGGLRHMVRPLVSGGRRRAMLAGCPCSPVGGAV